MAAGSDKIKVKCPDCSTQLRVRAELAGRWVRCPRCEGKFQALDSAPMAELDDDDVGPAPDDQFDDSAAAPARKRRKKSRQAEENSAAKICSIASIVCGLIALGFCPPVFGLTGLILGIIGVVLSENKTLAIVGIAVSVIGTVAGMIISYYVTMHVLKNLPLPVPPPGGK